MAGERLLKRLVKRHYGPSRTMTLVDRLMGLLAGILTIIAAVFMSTELVKDLLSRSQIY